MRYTSDLQLEIRAFSASLTNRDGSLCHAFIQDWRLLEPYAARLQRDFDMDSSSIDGGCAPAWGEIGGVARCHIPRIELVIDVVYDLIAQKGHIQFVIPQIL